ncbi:unnamed protein product [Leptosia nina]|uniref:Protein with SprT-like domain at the N terminus n=1 Tax=Leptosia nina TaxID=320188 RepID=A0AAV1IXU6_9NEOP
MVSVMNLADPELELIDPTPNVYALFLQFDKTFFWAKLCSRAVVRWSKRMYSCAGICTYDRGGLCDIALSEPLLKLRPRKDLVETLLHEMIHAFLFITHRDQDRDGHGPNFKAHMFRINQAAGLNISIYHDFHDEVKLYQTHWWRCNGPCQTQKPHFGIVRRTNNRVPGPKDFWWLDHQRKCGGTFVKIKEPEKNNKVKKDEKKGNQGDITKYITNNNDKTVIDMNKPVKKILKPITDSKFNTPRVSNGNLLVSKKNNVTYNPHIPKICHTDGGDSQDQTNVAETVRNVWANKTLPATNAPNQVLKRPSIPSETNSQPKKIKKIDDYFKSVASHVLRDVYGQDFNITQSKNDNKIIAVAVETENVVNCPICHIKISSHNVNQHLDDCLNKSLIEEISNSNNEEHKAVIHTKNNMLDNVKKREDCIDLTQVPSETVKCPTVVKTETIDTINIGDEIKHEEFDIPWSLDDEETNANKDNKQTAKQDCPCCGEVVTKPIVEHLDECLAFFDNNTSIPEEGASTSYSNETIVIDDLDESLELNETGTKCPCPCCMTMVEMADMNDHLDVCLK